MALIIPTAHSTFADATSLPGGELRSYVLAQVPEDTRLSWVGEVRSLCTVDELKWKVFQARRERLQAKTTLWKKIKDSMKSVTIVVIKPEEVHSALLEDLTAQGARPEIDFKSDDLLQLCATALVADTPVAYLPNRISEFLGLYPPNLYLQFDKFAPENIKHKIGGTLRDAKIFAARAHATFECANEGPLRAVTGWRSPTAKLVMLELLSTQRAFDEEHPKSVQVLNEAAETLATAMKEAVQFPGELTNRPLVREFRSQDMDHLQAADISAGWAHELIALGNENALGATFGKVLINGRMLP